MSSRRKKTKFIKKIKPKAETASPLAPSPFDQVFAGKNSSDFWHAFLKAVGTRPHDLKEIRGNSGVVHPLLACGIDEGRKRLVVISSEHDARSAAMAQGDMQAAIGEFKVAVVRPVTINLPLVARTLKAVLGGRLTLGPKDVDRFKDPEFLSGVLTPFVQQTFGIIHLAGSISTQVGQAIEQFALLNLDEDSNTKLPNGISFERLAAFDPAAQDRILGVCPVPIFDFTVEDLKTMLTTPDPGPTTNLLRGKGISQYFFPPPDQLALAVVEREQVGSCSDLVQRVIHAPQVGHPLAEPELTNTHAEVGETIEMLLAKNLIVEGEVGLETTPDGRSIRQTVRFKPREGFVSKLINQLKFEVSVPALFKVKYGSDQVKTAERAS